MREFYRDRLNRLLEIAPDEGFVQLLWAANGLQAGQEAAVAPFLDHRYSSDAATEDMRSRYFIYKWELETLANEVLTVNKRVRPKRGATRELRCDNYNNIVNAANNLRRLENAEARLKVNRPNILREMARIAGRQFDWQRGWFNLPQFYRSAFIYGQGACAAYFEERHTLTINQLSLVGFGMYTHLVERPVFGGDMDMRLLGIESDIRNRALSILSIPIDQARDAATRLRAIHPIVAYKPSLFRQYPCLAFGPDHERHRSPLPQLILERVTAGIFYDVIDGGGEIRADYGRRFEQYSLAYVQAALPDMNWVPERTYGGRGSRMDTPDILCEERGAVWIAIECKASRMSFEARFGIEPLEDRGYADIIKGVFQLWRFFSHCRRGLTGVSVQPETVGIVLTLDSWLLMAEPLEQDVLKSAKAMAAERDDAITEEDQRPIVFCSITDLESTLVRSTKASFQAAVAEAGKPASRGWMLSSIHERFEEPGAEEKPYPFRGDLGRLLPWWNLLDGRHSFSDASVGAPGLAVS